MDKQTLSQYGWLVTVILVLAIMIGLATPFATSIKNNFTGVVNRLTAEAEEAFGNIDNVAPGGGSGGNEGGGGMEEDPPQPGNVDLSDIGLGSVQVGGTANPDDVNFTYDPATGNLSGEVPPAEDAETPPEVDPEVKLIEFLWGEFKETTDVTYDTVEYEENYTAPIYPVSYMSQVWSKWQVTNDTIYAPAEISLSDIDEKHSTYIVYNFNTTEALEVNGVKGDSVEIYSIYFSSEDLVENAIYLAAYLNEADNCTDYHVGYHNGTSYVAKSDLDDDIAGVTTFSETKTRTKTYTISSSNTEYTFIPLGSMLAEEGMTWEEWLTSEYNTTGETEVTIVDENRDEVALDSVIEANKTYAYVATYVETLAGTTWYFNETLSHFSGYFIIDFTSGGVDFISNDETSAGLDFHGELYYWNADGDLHVYGMGQDSWVNQKYRLITITGGADATNPELIAWMKENAIPLNHDWVIPEGAYLEYYDENGEYHFLDAGEPFPATINYGDHYYYYYNGLSYCYTDGSWVCFSSDDPFSFEEAMLLESICGIPVSSLEPPFGGLVPPPLTTLIIAKNITRISDYAFGGTGYSCCENLRNIYYCGTVNEWNSISFGECWNHGCLEITVTCTDGTIIIPASTCVVRH